MTDSVLRLRVSRGLAWVGFASSAVGVLDIVAVVLILRYWVSQEQYGIATVVVSLYPILDVLTDMGLASAVIQRDDHDEDKISTIFWLNLAMSLLLLAILVAVAGPFAIWKGYPVVAAMLIAYGGKLVFQNVYAIPMALMKRELRFKELSLVRVIANLAEFAGKVGFAAAGFEIWCFVLGPFCRVLVTGIGLQLLHPWWPRMVLRIREVKESVRFGLKTSASQILFFFYTNVDYQIVDYYFGAAMLGFYRLAYELVLEPAKVLAGVVVEIAFPAFARLRGRRQELVSQFVMFTRLSMIVVIPWLLVVVLAGDEIVTTFVGEDWASAATAARILCFVGLLRALSFVVPPLLDGIGRAGTTLVYTAVASLVLPAAFVVCAELLGDRYGYLAVAIAWAVGYPIAFVVLAVLAVRATEMTMLSYLRRISGVVACAGAAGAFGLVARVATQDAPPAIRVAAVFAATFLVLGATLAWFQGLSPRALVRALRGAPPL